MAALIASIVIMSALITWRPYFQSVSLGQLADVNKNHPGAIATFRTLWESLFGIPIYGTFQWADQSVFASSIKHTDPEILTQPTKWLLRLVGRAYLLQAVFAFGSAGYLVYRTFIHGPESRVNVVVPAFRLIILSMLFICLSFTISTWMGGPNWLNGERPDQIIQFLPMFLYFIFLLPVWMSMEGTAGNVINGISYLLLFIFVTANLLCGFGILRDHLHYRGSVLSEADIPLTDKDQAVAYIAKDWIHRSSWPVISVDYDLDRGVWENVSSTEPATLLTKWYPASLTEGRGFDYELLRRYGLTNAKEGIQVRDFGDGRYLITYAFEDPPRVESGQVRHLIFGRLRVSVVDK